MPAVTRVARIRAAIVAVLVGLPVLGITPALLHRDARHVAPQARLTASSTRGALLASPLRAHVTPARSRQAQTIVAVGDSITKGDWDTAVAGGWVTRLGSKLRGAYPGRAFVLRNAGVDGDTTAGVLARLSHDVLAPHPALVIVSIGTNDFDLDVPPATFATELHLLVGHLHLARGAPVVVLASMLPEAGQGPVRLAAQRAYNNIIRRTATAMNVGYLDLFDMWLSLGPSYLHLLRHDSEHPNPVGYAWLASTTAAFLQAGYLDAHGRIVAPAVTPTCSVVVCGP